MKKYFRAKIVAILGWQVRRLQNKNDFHTTVVVGSVGKTSTKFAIANALQHSKTVRWQKGNYNDHVTVPLVFFGHTSPRLFNPFAWLSIFIQNELQLMQKYPYTDVIVELGTDGPGQILAFKQWLRADVAVVTSIAPEHMEFFKDLDAVAREELSVQKFSKHLIVNADLVDIKYQALIKKNFITYGTKNADITISIDTKLTVKKHGKKWLNLGAVHSIAEAYSKTAAILVADKRGVKESELIATANGFRSAPGRMQLLDGIKNSIIIDDTYNASPDAVIAALQTLYQRKSKHKIAMLGNMNELGSYSEQAHKMVGKYCDPKQLDLVITVGPDANEFIAPAAKAKGCSVQTFDSPYAAGEYVKKHVKHGSIVLAKGSQNNVYMEEALKSLLLHKKDQEKLVRQSTSWLKKKHKNFSHA